MAVRACAGCCPSSSSSAAALGTSSSAAALGTCMLVPAMSYVLIVLMDPQQACLEPALRSLLGVRWRQKGGSSDSFDHFPSIGSAAGFGTLKEVHAELGACSQESPPGTKTGARFGWQVTWRATEEACRKQPRSQARRGTVLTLSGLHPLTPSSTRCRLLSWLSWLSCHTNHDCTGHEQPAKCCHACGSSRQYLSGATTAAVLVRKHDIAAVGAVPVAVTSPAGLRTSRLVAAMLLLLLRSSAGAHDPRCRCLCCGGWLPARRSGRTGRLELATAASILPSKDEVVALRADPVAGARTSTPWRRHSIRAYQRLRLAAAASILVPEHNVVALRAVPVALTSRRTVGGDEHAGQSGTSWRQHLTHRAHRRHAKWQHTHTAHSHTRPSTHH